jgi:hypothetical protein
VSLLLGEFGLPSGIPACPPPNEQRTQERHARERYRDEITKPPRRWRFGGNPPQCLVYDPFRAGLFSQFAR